MCLATAWRVTGSSAASVLGVACLSSNAYRRREGSVNEARPGSYAPRR